MASGKKIRKARPEKVDAKRVKLPEPEIGWLEKFDRVGIPRKITRLLSLPKIAHATAIYAHKNNLSRRQKDSLIRLFHREADKALGITYKQVQLTVGHSPSDRMDYLKDFQSWEDRLIELIKEALDCSMDAEIWNEKLKALRPDNEPLFYENKEEYAKRLVGHLRLKRNVFNRFAYREKFVDFGYEALKLMRRFSAMLDITVERTEWMYTALKKFGKSSENKTSAESGNDSYPIEIPKNVSKQLGEPIIKELKTVLPQKELNTILQNLSSNKSLPVKTKGKVGRPKVKEAEAQRRRDLKAKWERARDAKVSKVDFCQDEDIEVEYLNNCVLRWCRDHPK